jgi:hypothetical protein
MKTLNKLMMVSLLAIPTFTNAQILTQEIINSVMATDSTAEKTPIVQTIAEQVQLTLKQAETLNLKNTGAYVGVTNQHNKIKNKTRPTSNQLTQLRQLNNELDKLIVETIASTKIQNAGKSKLARKQLSDLRAAKAQRLETERREAAEAKQLADERLKAAKAQRLETERLKAAEAKQLADERIKAEEALRLANERREAAEAKQLADERIKAEEALRLSNERRDAGEALMLDIARSKAEKLASDEANDLKETVRLANEAIKLENKRIKAVEALRLANEAIKLENDLVAKEKETARAKRANRFLLGGFGLCSTYGLYHYGNALKEAALGFFEKASTKTKITVAGTVGLACAVPAFRVIKKLRAAKKAITPSSPATTRNIENDNDATITTSGFSDLDEQSKALVVDNSAAVKQPKKEQTAPKLKLKDLLITEAELKKVSDSEKENMFAMLTKESLELSKPMLEKGLTTLKLAEQQKLHCSKSTHIAYKALDNNISSVYKVGSSLTIKHLKALAKANNELAKLMFKWSKKKKALMLGGGATLLAVAADGYFNEFGYSKKLIVAPFRNAKSTVSGWFSKSDKTLETPKLEAPKVEAPKLETAKVVDKVGRAAFIPAINFEIPGKFDEAPMLGDVEYWKLQPSSKFIN